MPSLEMLQLSDGITEKLNAMISRGRSLAPVLKRSIYPMYVNAQAKRFQTRGASEGVEWAPLNPVYAARKRVIYGGGPKFTWVGGAHPWQASGSWPSYPGKGERDLIATGRLYSSILGQNTGFANEQGLSENRVLVTDTALIVQTTTPYAHYVADKRELFKFGPEFWLQVGEALRRYVSKGRA